MDVKRPIRSACLLAGLVLAAMCGSPGARAGGEGFSPDDHSPDEGPAFFGFVKDARGAPVKDAKVTASYKTSLTLVTRTNAVGAYKVRGFKKEISPSEIIISCSKEGYRQVRTFRRPLPKGKEIKSVETECRLEAIKG